jgi:hypothetical protein
VVPRVPFRACRQAEPLGSLPTMRFASAQPSASGGSETREERHAQLEGLGRQAQPDMAMPCIDREDVEDSGDVQRGRRPKCDMGGVRPRLPTKTPDTDA